MGWSEAGRGRAVASIQLLQVGLSKHFAREESSGYLVGAVELAPRLSKIADRLLSEHDPICEGLDELEQQARTGHTDHDVHTFQVGVQKWARSMRKHERDENRLIHRAYSEDLGGRG